MLQPIAAAPAAAAGAKDVHVPDIGGDEVEVTEVMVKVGDKVAAEQSLITVEGDKVYGSAGTVCRHRKEIKISTGDKVSTGSLIMVFEVEGGACRSSGTGRRSGRGLNHGAAPAAKAEGKSGLLKTTLTFMRRR